MKDIIFKEFKEEDIPSLTPIMTRAFNYDSMLFLKKNDGPSGYNDGSFLKKWGLNPASSAFCIYYQNVLVGATILWINPNHYNFLGCLFIDPDYENKGLGTKVWKKIERMYPETIAWETETPIFSRRNHNFYVNKCGFHVVKIENPKDYENGQFLFQKVIKNNERKIIR